MGDNWFRNHPVIQSSPANRRIPFGIHGDDAGVHGKNQVLVLTWGGMPGHRLPVSELRTHKLLGKSKANDLQIVVSHLAVMKSVFGRCARLLGFV